MKNPVLGTIAMAMLIVASAEARDRKVDTEGYEVWAADQSNSISGSVAAGVRGSWIWIWDSADIEAQLAGGRPAAPLGCDRNDRGRGASNAGPCDLLEVFPQELKEIGANGHPTGKILADLPGFGRLHGMLADPQGRYVNANIFAPNGGFVGVIDRRTKEAVALFRVTGTNVGGGTDVRSVHMSFWSADGSAILIANLNGKLLERIDVVRSRSGKIKDLVLNRSATLGVGKDMEVTAGSTVFAGKNAHGRKMIGRIGGSYDAADLADLTPSGACRENGCAAGPDGTAGGRPNNVIICPVPTDNGNVHITMGGGGLLVADHTTTPMRIVGEYGNEVINGAGCGGAQVGDAMWLNAGVSASGAGADWSTFTAYTLDDAAFVSRPQPQNTPAPMTIFADPGNTMTGGRLNGEVRNDTGQLPDVTTRRDAHGVAVTIDGRYLHMVDRIQNVVEVFDTVTKGRSTYDLTSADGHGNGLGACATASVSDDPGLPGNDPAPDLLEVTPDGQYLMIAFRGPAPVSVTHSAQGSCPGVGVVELRGGGSSGALVGVLRSTNTVDTAPASAPGGHGYLGAERSDIHGAITVPKRAQTSCRRDGKGRHSSRSSKEYAVGQSARSCPR